LLDNPPFLSDRMKEIIFKDYSLAVYANHVLDYHGEMVINYSNTNGSRQPDSSQIRKLGRKDFTYLQSLDLNNPLYLFCFSYPTFTQELLRNEVLNVPRIGETPIGDWLREVKRILGPLMGIDKGLYYDMLVGNAFAMQFELELMPLTPKQVRNIKDYYRDGDLERILLRRNREIEAQARLKEELVINATPGVAPEELMQAIISRYKGKTVVVDYWATWCAPCLEAFGESRELKKQLAGKDVVFVYITSPSSPRKLWEKFIQGIGGQQYYLTSKEWAFLQRTYDFSGIPTYMIFDGNGALQQKFTGYPGNDEMLARIEAVLKGVSR